VGSPAPYVKGEFMIYLKAVNGQVKTYKDHDVKTIESLLATGKWVRVEGLKDVAPYSNPKTAKKKAAKKK